MAQRTPRLLLTLWFGVFAVACRQDAPTAVESRDGEASDVSVDVGFGDAPDHRDVGESHRILVHLTSWTADYQLSHEIANASATEFHLSQMPERFTVWVAIPEDPASLVYELDGKPFAADNVPAFFMDEEPTGRPKPWHPTLGAHVVTATSFSEKDGKGAIIDRVTRVYTFLP